MIENPGKDSNMDEETKKRWYQPMESGTDGEETLDLFEEAGLYELKDHQELLQEYADRLQKPEQKKRHWWQWGLWVLAGVAVLALIIVTAVYFSRDLELSAQEGMDPSQYFQYFQEDAQNQTISAKNEIPRAEPDPAVQLELVPTEGGEELELQELYDRCIHSVVGVMGQLSGRDRSWGTGIIMTEDGYILTNTHIISGCDGVIISLDDGREYEAKLVGADADHDVAVLKIDAQGLSAAVFADSDEAAVGDRVVAIGNPLSGTFSGTMTDGILSGLSRNVTYGGRTSVLLQTNAALNEGNSGGPLFNIYGQVIGITNMKMMTSSSYSTVEGIGFAIPATTVQTVANQLLTDGQTADRACLGIYVYEIAAEEDHPSGLLVDTVVEGTDAEKQGLKSGDIITAIDGTEITDFDWVEEKLASMDIGERVTLTIWREGTQLTRTITLMSHHELYGG
ncbi:MAG: trypsin-like peptidase domain-containing protein [Oscillospiraceae bacterium]|nr:trypsin-like peptidase domain-containing protein [Oscillospiraceae bacterium]